jgi:hypothetical protein
MKKLSKHESMSQLELVRLCREHGPEAVQTLLYLMRNGLERTRVRCAEVILDRAWGKADQAVIIGGDPNNPVIHEMIIAPRQESMLEWQARRAEMLQTITLKVLEHAESKEKDKEENS